MQSTGDPSFYALGLYYTGTQVNYAVVCERKLWLFSRHMEMEKTSDAVLLGRLIHEHAFAREKKEVAVDNRIVIDFSTRDGVIHEVKRSRSVEEAHRMQLLYYLYYLKQKGLEVRGLLHYPRLRRKVEVRLTAESERKLRRLLQQIQQVVRREKPPQPLRKLSFCKKCSYYELCYA